MSRNPVPKEKSGISLGEFVAADVAGDARLDALGAGGIRHSTSIMDVVDTDFESMIAGESFLDSGLRIPPGGVAELHVLKHVRDIARRLREQYRHASWMIVADNEIVGLCGHKAAPAPSGDVEIGYNVAASRQCRGHASAAVAAILETAVHDPAVLAVVAETAVSNIASQRVLEKNGFKQVGLRCDEADGDLILWRVPVKAQ